MEKRGYPRWAHFYLYSLSLIYLKNGTWELSLYIYTYIGILKKEEKGRIIKIESTTDCWRQEKRLMKIFLLRRMKSFFFFFGKFIIRWSLSRFLAKKVPRMCSNASSSVFLRSSEEINAFFRLSWIISSFGEKISNFLQFRSINEFT